MAEGCGEQKMRKFASAIMAKRYLDETQQLDATTTKTFNRILEQSLQEIMALQNSDGSFNLWGTSHRADWWKKISNSAKTKDYLDLTAYIVKLLAQYQAINPNYDESVMQKSMHYISKQQKNDGKFENNGNAQFRDLDKYSELDGVSLTVYVLIGILESVYLKKNYPMVVERGLQFIESRYYEILHDGTNYEQAMTFYLYVLAGKSHVKLLEKLKQDALKRDSEVYWEYKERVPSSLSMQIEVSSYMALGYIKLQEYDEAKPIIKFLMSKRNPKGGFETTTDTVLGLQALTEMSKVMYAKDTNINFTLRNQNNEEIIMSIGERQKRILSDKLAPYTKEVQVSATGKGVASFQISCQYKVKLENFTEFFEVNIDAKKQNDNLLKIHICVKTINRNISNMAIMEVNLPSGYKYHHGPVEDTENLMVK